MIVIDGGYGDRNILTRVKGDIQACLPVLGWTSWGTLGESCSGRLNPLEGNEEDIFSKLMFGVWMVYITLSHMFFLLCKILNKYFFKLLVSAPVMCLKRSPEYIFDIPVCVSENDAQFKSLILPDTHVI